MFEMLLRGIHNILILILKSIFVLQVEATFIIKQNWTLEFALIFIIWLDTTGTGRSSSWTFNAASERI